MVAMSHRVFLWNTARALLHLISTAEGGMGLTEYLTAESQIIPYMAFPRFLLEMDLPETAKIIYIMLLDRARMSLRKPGWVDEDGHLFVYYSVSDLAKDLKKSEMTIKNNLSALEEADLIFRQRSKPGLPSRTYVKVSVHSDSFLSHRETDNFPSEVQKTFSHTDRNLSANKNHISKTYNQRFQDTRSSRYHNRQRMYECGEGESL